MAFRWQTRGDRVPPHTGKGERWLFLVPHDDDAVIGAGMALCAAAEAGCEVLTAVTTDGSLGYCDAAGAATIVAVREAETRAALRGLGAPGVRFLGFSDGDLQRSRGRRPGSDEPGGGLQGAFTALFREFRPTRLFLCSSADIHPDHRIVYAEALISLFHAAGEIWPELGAPLEALPEIDEFPIYAPLPEEPDCMLTAGDPEFRRKLEAVAEFRSQRQIEGLVEKIAQAGPAEFFKAISFDLYDPARYRTLFP